LAYSGIKIFLNRNKEEKIEPQKHWLVKFSSKHFPVFKRYVGKNFFIRRNKKTFITRPPVGIDGKYDIGFL